MTSAAAKGLSRVFKDISEFEKGFLLASRGVIRCLINPLLSQMELTEKTTEPVDLFDSACGTAVLTQEAQDILSKAVLSKSTMLCADSSEQMVDIVKKRIDGEGWINVKTSVMDAKNTGLPDNSFSHVGLGLALHLIPGPDTVLADCKRILKPGGIFGATTFHNKNTFWIPDMRAAFASFPFDAHFPDEVKMQMHSDGDWTDPAWIEDHLRSEGFSDVQVKLNPGTYHLRDADEYVTTFGAMMGWFMNTWWSEETRKAHPLEEVQRLLKSHLEEKYEGKGWDINYLVICMTGKVEK
ncbi:S-adenosyl-L-methionine-dependent methyltransferase [Dactylonectria macrodidyma]|uniref:S-adenosyl-L-methionine-dependent methyltransferase n=1 Tax=Dactylonectria macrodidyma TaxID=307937 RepID=A0A9P9ETS2_9HYPO|nr:S-adenosyl-L-methionine-dependent methyltransferase [Dactylonectria macrodidyma]